MIRKLQHRFILITMVLVGFVILLGMTIFGYVLYQQQTRQLVGALNAAVNAGLHQSAGAVADDGYMDNTHAFKTFSVIVDPDGDIISSDGNENELAEVENWHDVVEKVISSNGTMGKLSKYDLMYKRVYDLNTGYSTIAFINNSQLNKYMFSLLTIAITLFCSLMVIMFVVSWFLSTLAIRPLNKAWNQQQQFVADASHELKTPLTVILANNNILLSHKEWSAEKQRKWIENSQAEAGHMKELVDNLLYLARLDANKSTTVLSAVPLGELIMDISLQFEPVAFEKGSGIDYGDVDTDITISGDTVRLKQLVYILLDNAIKYGEKGTDIKVSLITKGGRPEFTVNNQGDPIGTEDMPHLFERFYRANKARNREEDAGGYGLGLAIAKSIADDHGAKIHVASNKKEGTTFGVTFKRQ